MYTSSNYPCLGYNFKGHLGLGIIHIICVYNSRMCPFITLTQGHIAKVKAKVHIFVIQLLSMSQVCRDLDPKVYLQLFFDDNPKTVVLLRIFNDKAFFFLTA